MAGSYVATGRDVWIEVAQKRSPHMRRTHLLVRQARATPPASPSSTAPPWATDGERAMRGAGRGLVGKGDASLRVLTSEVGACR